VTFLQKIVDQYHITQSMYQIQYLENGNSVIRFTMGIAILLSPFFFIAHFIALNFGFEPNGYSEPYHWMLHIGSAFYILLGYFILRKVLLKNFTDKISALILIIFYAGTNIFLFTSLGNPFPHVFAFILYLFVIYYTILWHHKPKLIYAILLGMSLGLLVITRISEAIAIIIPVLWGVYNKETLIRKWNLIRKQWQQVLLIIFCGLLVLLPQLIYWQYVTGKPLFFAYSDPSSSLELTRPRFAWVLFSYRKGWLLYSPLMILSLTGFILVYRNCRKYFYPTFIFFLVNLYLLASFTSLVSYGYRAFIQSYAVLIIPFGFTIKWLYNKNKTIKIIALMLFIIIAFVNIFQSWQIRTGVLHGRRMTKEYYWRIFLKNEFEPEDRELLLVQRFYDGNDIFKNEEDFNKKALFFNSFESPSGWKKYNYRPNPVSHGNFSFLLDSTVQYLNGLELPFKNLTQEHYAWIRPSLKVFPVNSVEDSDVRLVIGFTHNGKMYKYRAINLGLEKFQAKPNQWNTITWDYLTPEIISINDVLTVYVWHRGKGEAYIDEFRIDAFTLD